MSDYKAKYVVQIIEDATDKVVKETNPMDHRQAEKVEGGMEINLNWEKYSIRLREVE